MEVSEHDRAGASPREVAQSGATADPKDRVRGLIAECHAVALKIAQSLCRRNGWGDPGDLVNEIVERALTRADQLSRLKQNEFQAWLNTALTHRFIDWCRRRTTERDAAQELRAMEAEAVRSPEDAHLRAAGKVTPERFQQAVDELKPEQRECLLLQLIHGLKHREIAEKLKKSPGTVGWLISEAKRHLRERFLGLDGAKS
jgi:RNA polymerase sigma-70 factor, ECF subfamily